MIDLTAPRDKGTYIVLVEPTVVKIGASGNIANRVKTIRGCTFRRVVLLAWSNAPEREIHRRFVKERVVPNREFFWLSEALFEFVNESRQYLGFPLILETDLEGYGEPLAETSMSVEEDLPEAWEVKLWALPKTLRLHVGRLLATKTFRSQERKELRDILANWASSPDVDLPFLTSDQWAILRGFTPKDPQSPEDQARLGRCHTHLRWHRNPKAGCEFCVE